jgi:hypothetical protein
MLPKKLTLVVFFSIFSNNLWASSSTPNWDIMGGAWYVRYPNFPIYNSLDNTTSLFTQGPHFMLMGLYSLYMTRIGSPVIGIEISHTKTEGSSIDSNFDSTTGYSSSGNDVNSSFTFIDLTGGYKFSVFSSFSVFMLGNFGYSVSNLVSGTSNSYNGSTTNTTNQTNNISISNHFKYGASLILLYSITKSWGIGFNGSYNQHFMTASGSSSRSSNNGTSTINIPNTSSTFSETSIDALISYSF